MLNVKSRAVLIRKGPSIKDVRSRGGRGLVKSGHMPTQGVGGLWQKADVLKLNFLPKFSKF